MTYFLALVSLAIHVIAVGLGCVSGMFMEEAAMSKTDLEKSRARRNARFTLVIAFAFACVGVATAVLAGGLWK